MNHNTNAARYRTLSLTTVALLVSPVLAGAGDLTGDEPSQRIAARAHGTYSIADTTATVELRARQRAQSTARGKFRHTLVFQGLLIDFVGDVTCIAVDADNGRAWIGGIVTENNSDHPDFSGDRNQPGKDIWFRVLDNPDDRNGDRTTFVGFEGDGGIITSLEYCESQIWPGPPDDEPNARTNPMIDGRIKVKG